MLPPPYNSNPISNWFSCKSPNVYWKFNKTIMCYDTLFHLQKFLITSKFSSCYLLSLFLSAIFHFSTNSSVGIKQTAKYNGIRKWSSNALKDINKYFFNFHFCICQCQVHLGFQVSFVRRKINTFICLILAKGTAFENNVNYWRKIRGIHSGR